MKKLISMIAALWLSIGLAQADTSYLLIQGPFGTSGAVETFKWEVNYAAGTLSNGYDLLTAALTSSAFDATNWGTSASPSYFLNSITLSGSTVANGTWTTNPDWSGHGLTWNYYAASATDGAWSIDSDGLSGRSIANGSYDGWVFGYTAYDSVGTATSLPSIDGAANTPAVASFADATAVNVEAVPEPGCCALLIAGGTAVLALRRKFRKA